MSKNELLKGLTDEQIEKLKACKSPDEMLALAKAEGIELSDEQLSAVNGGFCKGDPCPKCGNEDTESGWTILEGYWFHCPKCDNYWPNPHKQLNVE